MNVALQVRDLRVTYPGPPSVRALDGVDLNVIRGECLGLLGESGSGKSTLARVVLGLATGARVEGALQLGDQELGTLDEAGWRRIRWTRLALAMQSTAALNPVLRIVDQVAEPLRVHLGHSRGEARERALATLASLGLGRAEAERFPFELSGGQQRLAVLAVAVVCEPEILLLDEPTAGLDAVTRDQVVAFLRSLRERRGTTIVVLGHDVEALHALADRVGVLYRGWLAEIGPAARVLGDPRHPYSRGLLDARPTLATIKELRGIRGRRPDPALVSPGCPFYGRCTQSVSECTEIRPALEPPAGERDSRLVSCIRGGVLLLLEARGLRKSYGGVHALDDVGVEVRHGEVLGVVGPTGAGKSTLALLLANLLVQDAGTVTFDGHRLNGKPSKDLRRRLQLVFQNPFEALSPRLTVLAAVREPLEVQRAASRDEATKLVRRALDSCRLPSDDAFLGRHTHELSGGELQRVALARALVLEPQLVVLDEPVAMLDPSEQAELLQLLKAIQVERGMAMVLVSHDLATVLRVADSVVVLAGGRVVERGSGTQILTAPRHAVTRALLAASGAGALFHQQAHSNDQEAQS